MDKGKNRTRRQCDYCQCPVPVEATLINGICLRCDHLYGEIIEEAAEMRAMRERGKISENTIEAMQECVQ